MWELVPVIAFFGLLGLIGYVMYKLLDAGVAFWKAAASRTEGAERRGSTTAVDPLSIREPTASEPRAEPKAVAPPAPKSDQERHRQMLEQFHSQRRGEK